MVPVTMTVRPVGSLPSTKSTFVSRSIDARRSAEPNQMTNPAWLTKRAATTMTRASAESITRNPHPISDASLRPLLELYWTVRLWISLNISLLGDYICPTNASRFTWVLCIPSATVANRCWPMPRKVQLVGDGRHRLAWFIHPSKIEPPELCSAPTCPPASVSASIGERLGYLTVLHLIRVCYMLLLARYSARCL